ncbi:hypothetical protein WS69_13585 [Burkholderia sp. BDU5]|nr:hypothetical protein WS69_13585 [Burkholderia sp. BDU5]
MQEYPGTGTNGPFEFNFAGGYIDQSHVKAYRYDPVSALTYPQTLTFIGQNQVRTSDMIPTGQFLVLYRDTPKDKPLVDYSEGAVMDEANLDKSNDQNVFIAAEMLDRFDSINATSGEAIQRSVLAYNTANEALDLSHQALDASGNAVSTANSALSKANTAISTANDAHDIAVGIDAKAQAALDASATAVSTANQAKSTADGIDAKASKALTDSASAVSTANGAASNATQALNTANSVSGKADNAVATANDAAAKANNAYQKTGGVVNGEVSSTNANSFRIAAGNYGVFVRNDSTSAFLMQTNAGDQYGTWNSYRPFSWNLSSGAVTIDGTGAGITTGGRVTVGQDVVAKGVVYANNGAAQLASDGNINGTQWGGWLSNVVTRKYNDTNNYGYVVHDTGNKMVMNWDGRVRLYVDGQHQGAIYTDTWFNIGNYATNGRADDLQNQINNNYNASIKRSTGNNMWIGWDGNNGGRFNFSIDDAGIRAYIQSNVGSDYRLKRDIKPTEQDSLALVNGMKFKQFVYKESGWPVSCGLIAQQVRVLKDDLVYQPPGDPLDGKSPLMLDQVNLLLTALHAIQQLSAEVEALKAAAR